MIINAGPSPIANRTVSSFPISIGTALALESIFPPRISPYDPERPIPSNINLNNYQSIYINLATLFRNLQGSIDKQVFISVSDAELVEGMLADIEMIDSLFAVEGRGICKPIYYFCDYKEYYTSHKYQNIIFRHDHTEIQKFATRRLMSTVNAMLKADDRFLKLDSKIHPESRHNALIITHFPVDLLNYKRFEKLSLLESHTGKLKDRFEWNSKYASVPNENISILPFLKKLLLVFGDRVMIQPSDLKLRRLIMETAKNRHWTPMTTLDKVNLDLSLDIKEPYVLKVLKMIE